MTIMQRFFVSGYPKSGTTFLQMLLDSHPNINCPSEQNLAYLFQHLFRLTKNYRRVIREMDRKTGGQGIRYDGQKLFGSLLRSAVGNLMLFGATAQTTHAGLNDNMMASHGDLVARLMPNARFVFIVRDPREVAVSLWHHKMRTEPGFARRNPPIETTLAFVGRSWPQHLDKMETFASKWRARSHIVRYEDLRGPERDIHLGRMLSFLDAPASTDVLADMWHATEFDSLRERERTKEGGSTGFFRSGRIDSWREQAPAAAVSDLVAAAGVKMTSYGYAA